MTRRVVKKTGNANDNDDLLRARNELLAAVENYGSSSPRPLLRLFVSASSNSNSNSKSIREQKKILLQALQHFSKAAARRFFAGLDAMLTVVLENEDYIPESAYVATDEKDMTNNDIRNDDNDEEVLPDAKSSEFLHFLQIAALVTQAYLDGLATSKQQLSTSKNKSAAAAVLLPVIEEAFQVAESLHDILFVLSSCGPDAVSPQSAIVSLCESWWLHHAVNRELLVPRSLSLIVNRALAGDSPSSEIKRLYQMRDAFGLFDFADPDSDALRSLLLRVVSSPSCLRVPQGRRFIAHLFYVLDTILVPDLHRAMRVHIPDNKKTLLQAYGEIYFRAWMDAPDNKEESDEPADDEDDPPLTIRQSIETHVLSDLMYAAIHVANPTMSKSLLTVLQPFHDARKKPDVEDLLHRLYSPILWRSLSAANATIRLQAARVLAQVFPLQDASHSHTESAVRKAGEALQALLVDRDARVRVAGSEVIAQVLTAYWDVMPTEIIRSVLNYLVAEHASDASSSAVRAGALNAVALLLEAPQSHAVLRPLLPSLGNLIHDKVETVRVAAVRLLLCVKKTPGIKYYHVVPVDHLTARLTQEEGQVHANNAVASGITALMLNSYFPANKSGPEQFHRTLTFLTNDPVAAAVFYANIAAHLPLQAVTQLATMLWRCLDAAVETEQKHQATTGHNKRRRRFGRNHKDKIDPEEEADPDVVEEDTTALSAADTALMAAIAETICILWQSVEKKLEQDEECNQWMIQQFSGATLTNALTHFEQRASEKSHNEQTRDECYRTCAAILRLAGRLSSKAVQGLVPHISSVLSSLARTSAVQPRQNVSAHIALLCLWGKTDEVAPSLASSIEADFESYHELLFASPEEKSKKRKSGRSPKVGLAVPPLPPAVALDLLADIFRGSDPSSVAARDSILLSASSSNAIERALERGTRHAERLLAGDSALSKSVRNTDVEFLLRVCELYGRFALHMQASSKGLVEFSKRAERLLQWTTLRVVPALTGDPHGEATASVSFIDPDLSSIAFERSFESFPSSPIPTGPPKRRANRNRTPDKVRGSFQTPKKAPSTTAVGRAFAVSLMHSSCVIFSEWLAVGGAGGQQIDAAAAGWCQIFPRTPEGNEESLQTLQESLLPAFSRLATQISKTSQQFVLLKELLVTCTGTGDEASTDALKSALTSLLSSRGTHGTEIVTQTIQCILQASYLWLDRDATDELVYELPNSLGELWPANQGSVALALRAVFSNKQASLVLGKLLTESVNQTHHSVARALFHAKCLFVLCDPGSNRSWSEIVDMVRKIDTNLMDHEHGLHGLLDSLKNATA